MHNSNDDDGKQNGHEYEQKKGERKIVNFFLPIRNKKIHQNEKKTTLK